jgi:hypothetical protein
MRTRRRDNACLGRTDAFKQQVSYDLVECFFVTIVKLAALFEYLFDLEANYSERQSFF